MSDADTLMQIAQRQLEEHRAWLCSEIGKLSVKAGHAETEAGRALIDLARQALNMRVRVVSARVGSASVLYEYPDELYAFLASDRAPPHLRASIAGGHVVSPGQPAVTVERAP